MTFTTAAFGMVIRTSALLLCVSLLSLTLKRSSASVRHALWAVGLLAVLVFPVVSRWIPEFDLAILPQSSVTRTAFDTTPAALPIPDAVSIDVVPEVRQSHEGLSPAVVPGQLPTAREPGWTIRWTTGQWLFLLWGLGSGVFLFGWLKSVRDLHGLTRESTTLLANGWDERLREAQRTIGIAGTVHLRISRKAISPMTWGIFRKVILMPAAAVDWSPVRQRLVLAHEMAHVKRYDSVGQLLAQMVCTMYWFNPVAWYAVHRLHAERERACDDCVLRLGADGSDYADHLLQITRGLNNGFAQAAVSMAHPSQLKSRLIAILDSGMQRSRASRFVATTLLTIVGVLTLSLSAIQLTALTTLVLPAFAAPLAAPLWSPEPIQPIVMAQQPAVIAAQQTPAAALDPQSAFIKQYCVTCHNADDNVANLRFGSPETALDHVADNRKLWEKVVLRLRAGRDDSNFDNRVSRPPAATINSLIRFLETELDRNARTYVPPIGSHRLNRTEYQNVIRDLLDLEIDSTQLLPPDDYTRGFDTILTALDSPRMRNAYTGVAPIISRLAIQTSPSSSSYQKVLICKPSSYRREDQDACAKKILTTLIENAFRGNGTLADVDASMAAYAAVRNGATFEEGIENALSQILASPKFIYRPEDAPADMKPGDAYRISDTALASRLSFFLWSSSPDMELIELAKQGKLHDPAVLEQQTLRMLKDYRADALSTNFAGQWLNLTGMNRVSPVPALFPTFDAGLRQAMRREGELFFDSIVREDRSVVDLLTADYTFVNNRLARHYGIPNVTGNQFRRITLTDAFDVRRGILGKAAFLTVTSRDNRTSPVTRAKWITSNLLGVGPPDPPPDVRPLKPRSNDPNVINPSMRATMEESIATADWPAQNACISCHRLIDPIGFSLENFNAIGIWRTEDGGAPVNAADTLYDGTSINGPADLRRWLVAHSDQFVQVVTEKLMTYALGRGIEPQDMPLIRAIDREAARNNNRFSAIVLGIVKSDAFQMNSK